MSFQITIWDDINIKEGDTLCLQGKVEEFKGAVGISGLRGSRPQINSTNCPTCKEITQVDGQGGGDVAIPQLLIESAAPEKECSGGTQPPPSKTAKLTAAWAVELEELPDEERKRKIRQITEIIYS